MTSHNSQSFNTKLRPMRVTETAVYRGPNLHDNCPLIRIQVDLGELEDWPSARIPQFADRLIALLPGLQQHGCCYGRPGGFVSRLREGTWLCHVAEHVALELQAMVGATVTRGKTRSVPGLRGFYNILYAYEDEEVGLKAGQVALEIVQSLLPGDLSGILGLGEISGQDEMPFDMNLRLDTLRALQRKVALGPTTAALVREAKRRDIPVARVDDSSLFQLGHGRHQKRLRASCTGATSEIAAEIAADKDLTRQMLAQAGLPVPRGILTRSEDEAVEAALKLGFPVVVKPLDGNHGRGVNVDLITVDEVRWAFGLAREHGRTVIVEKHLEGNDHRILVIGGKVVAVAERVPAQVIGDGQCTITQLVALANLDPRRDEGHCAVLTRISIDECVLHFLAGQGLAPDSVPDLGQQVRLRPTANLSTGGTAVDRTDDIHPFNALIARRAANIVGLDVAGIDFVCPDITRPVSETGGGVIEVNAGPGFRMHLQPSEGRPRNVARPMIDLLFPPGAESRIPIFAITGTNGKSTSSRMLAHILKGAGLTVGLTDTTGIRIGDAQIMRGDCSGPKSARLVLREPGVDAAVLETARGGILREGLGFDRCDVGAVLNVSADHLGLKGLQTVEDLAEVKGVVVESVKRGGWSVLNADDPLSAGLESVARGRICYFSMRNRTDWPDFLQRHVAAGGRVINREMVAGRPDIMIHEDGDTLFLIDAARIPATHGGLAEFNIANAMAAAAMAHADGIPVETIQRGLASFSTGFEHLPGRLNIHEGHGFTTIVDYVHNPHGLEALGQFLRKLKKPGGRAIGLVSMAGDRRDVDIREMGAGAARLFDVIVIREDGNRRGRKPGELAALLREGALMAGKAPEDIHIVLDEAPAVDFSLRQARTGDLLLIAVEEIDDVWRQVREYRPDVPFEGVAQVLAEPRGVSG